MDSDGNVTTDFVRTDWGLICRSKFEDMDDPEEDFVVHETFEEGDVVPKSHEMFRPMVII